jgi:hypothetical protein
MSSSAQCRHEASSRSSMQAWVKGREEDVLDRDSGESDPWTIAHPFKAVIWIKIVGSRDFFGEERICKMGKREIF